MKIILLCMSITFGWVSFIQSCDISTVISFYLDEYNFFNNRLPRAQKPSAQAIQKVFSATRQGKYKLLKKLFKKYPIKLYQDGKGNTPLHVAMMENIPRKTKVIKTLLELHPEQLACGNTQEITPLHRAIMHNLWHLIEPFVKQKLTYKLGSRSGITLLTKQDQKGCTPLHYAILQKNADLELIKKLIMYAPQAGALRDKQDHTPIHLAANRLEVLHIFIQAAFS